MTILSFFMPCESDFYNVSGFWGGIHVLCRVVFQYFWHPIPLTHFLNWYQIGTPLPLPVSPLRYQNTKNLIRYVISGNHLIGCWTLGSINGMLQNSSQNFDSSKGISKLFNQIQGPIHQESKKDKIFKWIINMNS